jgi:alpha-tubulin suppressor-like RCC1 family protein
VRSEVPLAVRGTHRFASVATGASRSCATEADGTAWCWGLVWLYEQQGLDWSQRTPTPTRVPGTDRFRMLSVGATTSCGVRDDGRPICWEAGSLGQMGTGRFAGSTHPTPVAGALVASAATVGVIHACAIAVDRTGWCWGNNTFGELGDPFSRTLCGAASLECAPTPTRVVGELRFVSLAAGLGSHMCGVTTLTNLYCWGLAESGQLGIGERRAVIRRAPSRVRRG